MVDEVRRRALKGMGTAAVPAAGLMLAGDAAPLLAAEPGAAAGAAASRAELAARRDPEGILVYLAEAGREGLFVRRRGAPPLADRLQGLFVSAEGDHYARLWDGIHGRPEWFGARVNDGRADCADAIEACYQLCPVTELGQEDYFIRRTLRFGRSWRTVRGVGRFATDQNRGTRIILQGSAPGVHDDDILVVGSVRQPGGDSESFPYENHLSNFTLIRDGQSRPHRSGDLARYPAGLRAGYLNHCTFREIASLESSVGFSIGGVVYTKFDDCLAQRLAAGTGDGEDLAVGYYLDGRPSYGMAGGNASVYMSRCLAVGQHPRHVRPTGLLAEGAFVDTFLDWFESARIDTGITFRTAGATARGRTVDVHVRNAVLDGCGRFGMEFDLTGTVSASIEITDPYIHAAGGGGDRGILVHDGAGLVTMVGGQVHGDFRGGSVWLSATRGVRVAGLKIHEASRPMVVAGSGGLQLEPQITNVERATGGFAISCTAVYRTNIRPVVVGAPGHFGGGVSLDGDCNYCQVDGTAVDPGCFAQVTGARKLWFDGSDATQGTGAEAFRRRFNVVTGVLG